MIPAAPAKLDALAASYVAAHFGKSLLWYMIELLFGFFLAEIYGIPPRTLGLLLAAFLLWDAITDPIVALVIAYRPISTRNLLRIQLFGTGISAAAFWLVFLNPVIVGIAAVPYALIVGILFRTTYSIVDVPQNALLKRLASNAQRRLTLSSLRAALSALATLAVSLASATILAVHHTADRSERFALAAGVLALVAVGTSAWLAYQGKQKVYPDIGVGGSLTMTLRVTLLDRRLIILFLAMFFLSLGWPLFGKLIPFFASYVQHTPAATGVYLAAMAIAAFVSQPIWIIVGNRIRRRRAILLAFGVMTAGATIFLLSAPASSVGCLLGVAVMSAGASALSFLTWTQLADRLSEQALSQANDVLAFGIFTSVSKLALGIGGLLIGGALLVAGYAPGERMSYAGQSLLTIQMVAYPLLAALAATILGMLEGDEMPRGRLCDTARRNSD